MDLRSDNELPELPSQRIDSLLLLGCDDKDGGREASYPIEVNVYDVCSS